MRKFMISLLAISFFIVMLSGCKEKSPEPLCNYFSGDAVILADDRKFDVKVSSTIGQNVTLSYLSGDSTKGLSYRVTNSTMYISYGELSCMTKVDYLPSFCYADVVIDTLLSMQKNTASFVKEVEQYNEYKLDNGSGEVRVFADKKSGCIAKIKPMYADCEISFSDVKKQ